MLGQSFSRIKGKGDMPKAYSMDLRERVLSYDQEKTTSRELANKYNISYSTINDWRRKKKETGDFKPKKMGGHSGSKLNDFEMEIRGLIKNQCDITLEEIKNEMNKIGVETSVPAISRFLQKLKITRKKNTSSRRAR
jgi:transposase